MRGGTPLLVLEKVGYQAHPLRHRCRLPSVIRCCRRRRVPTGVRILGGVLGHKRRWVAGAEGVLIMIARRLLG